MLRAAVTACGHLYIYYTHTNHYYYFLGMRHVGAFRQQHPEVHSNRVNFKSLAEDNLKFL